MKAVLVFLIAILWVFKTVFVSLDLSIVTSLLPIVIAALVLFLLSLEKQFVYFLHTKDIFKILMLLNVILVYSFAVAVQNGYPLINSIETTLKWITIQSIFIFGAYIFFSGMFNKLYIFMFMLSVVIHLIFGAIAPIFGIGAEIKEGITRYSGLAGKINILANFALFFSVFFFVLFERSKSKMQLLLFLLAMAVVFITGTLKNVLVLFVLISFYIFINSKNKKLLIPVGLFILLPFMLSLVFYLPIGERLMEFQSTGVNLDVEHGEQVGNSLNWRILHWKFLWDDWYSNHFLFGTGLGQSQQLNGLKTVSGGTFDPHNDWLKLLVELGAVGFVALILILSNGIKEIKKFNVNNNHGTALYYSLVSCMLAMFAANVIYSLVFFYYFWLILGFLWCKYHLFEKGD
jgi:O-antigen ligase